MANQSVQNCWMVSKNVISPWGLSMLGLTQGWQQEGQLQRVSISDGWEHLQDTHPLTDSSEMDRQVPIKTGWDTFELEGLGALWDVWHPFYFICLNHHSFLIMVTCVLLAVFLDSGMKPGYLEKTTRERHVNVGKCLGWNQTHNLPALRPLNSKERKQRSDWLVFYFICLSFFS